MTVHHSVRAALHEAVCSSFSAHGILPSTVVLTEYRRDSAFDYQTAAALQHGARAREIAGSAATALRNNTLVAAAEVSGPGFLCVRLADEAMVHHPDDVAPCSGTVVVDFGGPNVAKPLHVGHLRSLVVGESLRRILSRVGYRVVSDIHLGDWGLQMGMLIDAIGLIRPDLPYFDPGRTEGYPETSPVTFEELEALYPRAAKDCKAFPERMAGARKATAELQSGRPGYVALWKHMREESMTRVIPTVRRLGARFDLMLGESDTRDAVPPMIASLVASGTAVESEGAVVIPVALPEDGERPMPPFILLKSDGATLYSTTDLATLLDRMDRFQPDRVVYVVDERQAEHFRQLARASVKAGVPDGIVKHAGFGTVNGTDGKPLKTRDGGAPKLDDLIDGVVASALARCGGDQPAAESVALAALKFADLSSPRGSGYIFDPSAMTSFEGDTGPYVQYAAVRARSVVGRTASGGKWEGSFSDPERALALECSRFQDAVLSASDELEPCRVAQQALRIAKAFNRFYGSCQVVGSGADEPRRVALCERTAATLADALHLLGIEVPERM